MREFLNSTAKMWLGGGALTAYYAAVDFQPSVVGGLVLAGIGLVVALATDD